VRVARGGPENNLPGQLVELIVDGKGRTAKTGRTVARHLPD
jgi:hypothetical protein